MKAEQPEIYEEFIKLCTHSKPFADYISVLLREGLENEQAISSSTGYPHWYKHVYYSFAGEILWYAAKDCGFDSKRLYQEYSHTAKLAELVGIVFIKGEKPQILTAGLEGTFFALWYEQSGEVDTELFQPDDPPYSWKLATIHGRPYLVTALYGRPTAFDTSQRKIIQYILIRKRKFTVTRTRWKDIPL